MAAIYLYFAKTIFITGILTGWYWIGLRRTKLHHYNRAFLLFALCTGLLLPLFHFQWFSLPATVAGTTGAMPLITQAISSEQVTDAALPPLPVHTSITGNIVAFIAIAVVSLFLLGRLIFNIISVLRMAARLPPTRGNGALILHTDLPGAPFSFFTYLFWRNNIPRDSDTGSTILRHEMVHIRQRHSVDRLFSQALTCICWFNPFFWLIRKELELVHEYLADERSVRENDTAAFAMMMLGVNSNAGTLLPQHNFFSSTIKQRLTMLQKTNKTRYASLRRLTVLPLFAGLMCIFSFAPAPKKSAVPAAKKLVLVVDAGHGGSDVGAGQTTYLEKHLVLQFAKRLKELAPQHNIDVHLTRSSDDNIVLSQRVAMANQLSPDAFITLHIGNDKKADLNSNMFVVGVAVASGNKRLPASIELGKNVYSQVLLTGNVRKNAEMYNVEKGLFVCRESTAPAILIELGDINNNAHMARLTNAQKVDELCEAILNGVATTKL